MLRKFYAFKPHSSNGGMIAAISYFNTKAFEDGCKEHRVPCAVISEEAARTALESGNGVGAGVYTSDCRIDAPEALRREQAMKLTLNVAQLTGVMFVEEPIRLEPIRQLVDA